MGKGTGGGNEARATTIASPEFEPRRFGPYVLLRRLGHGGTASVYLASEPTPGGRRPVVLKRLHEHLSEDPYAREVFLDEARLGATLEHPGIVRAFDHGVIEGRPFFTMEYVSSVDLETLFARLERETQRLPTPIVVRIGLDLLSALDYAHGLRDPSGKPLGIVHRDISPENVLLTFTGGAMLLDFGIAKARTRHVRTSTGVVKGKFAYMAPEQAEADDVDARADVWSLGVLLWELFAGRRLFAATSQFASLTSSMLGVIPKLDEAAGVPKALSDVVERALQRDRDLRHASAAAMATELQRALGSPPASQAELATFLRDRFPTEIARDAYLVATPIPDEPRALGEARPIESPTGPRRRMGLVFALSVLAIAGTAAVVFTPSESSTNAPPERGGHERAAGALPTPAATPSPSAPPPPVSSETSTPPMPPTEARDPKEEAVSPRTAPARGRATSALPAPTPTSPRTEPAATASAAAADAPTARASTGRLSLVSVPWSRVELDGRVLGNTPLVGIELPTGTHVLVLTNTESGVSLRYPVTITEGHTTVRRVALGP